MSNEETTRITSIPEVDELVREQESPSIELAPRRPKENRLLKVGRHKRYKIADDFEKPVSLRESWWRSTIKESPVPGKYNSYDYLNEYLSKPNSYQFRAEGRHRNPQPQILYGATALPGAYNIDDFVDLLNKRQTTYNFKSVGRSNSSFVDYGKDKDVQLSPTQYGIEKVGSITSEHKHCGLWQFKSRIQRFPTLHFQPKIGPGPGAYEDIHSNQSPIISSSFKSRTPRFATSHSKTPGPGMYEKTQIASSLPPSLTQAGRQYGIFYSGVFQA